MKILKITATDKNRAIKLIKDECSNCISGDCVLTETACAQIARVRKSSTDEGVDSDLFVCRWFHENVLPLDRELENDLGSNRAIERKVCQCGKEFVPKSNRQRFCSVCAARNERNKNAERQRRRYTKNLTV